MNYFERKIKKEGVFVIKVRYTLRKVKYELVCTHQKDKFPYFSTVLTVL